MERSPKLSPTRQLALRFIAGKYKGSELLLEDGQQITVGRVGDVDMILAEDMVSRLHARIWLEGHRIVIEDLGSTNGTFVNGEKIRREVLKEGDRILIGTNILKVVSLDPGAPGESTAGSEPPEEMNLFEDTRALANAPDLSSGGASPQGTKPDDSPSSISGKSRAGAGRSMSGAIDDFPLPYLLQLLESSQKSGVLVIRGGSDEVAKIYLRKGVVVFATMSGGDELPPLKVVFRTLNWTRGTFDLETTDERTFPNEIDATVQELLMEGLRQIDEMNNLRNKLPEAGARLVLVRPLKAPLRDLQPAELDTLQIAINHGVFSTILNKSPATDFDAARSVLKLMDAGYLRVG